MRILQLASQACADGCPRACYRSRRLARRIARRLGLRQYCQTHAATNGKGRAHANLRLTLRECGRMRSCGSSGSPRPAFAHFVAEWQKSSYRFWAAFSRIPALNNIMGFTQLERAAADSNLVVRQVERKVLLAALSNSKGNHPSSNLAVIWPDAAQRCQQQGVATA